jgi:hypothetical protein
VCSSDLGTPFSSYALAEKVYIDGVLRYDRAVNAPPESDFLLGQNPPEEAAPTEVQP